LNLHRALICCNQTGTVSTSTNTHIWNILSNSDGNAYMMLFDRSENYDTLQTHTHTWFWLILHRNSDMSIVKKMLEVKRSYFALSPASVSWVYLSLSLRMTYGSGIHIIHKHFLLQSNTQNRSFTFTIFYFCLFLLNVENVSSNFVCIIEYIRWLQGKSEYV
jgi:hypothetical protein